MLKKWLMGLMLLLAGAAQAASVLFIATGNVPAGKFHQLAEIARPHGLTVEVRFLGSLPASHPEASPLHHPALSGLPPTHIVTAEYDPLRDEGEALYGKLVQAGVDATCQRQHGVIHGYFQLAAISPAARQLIDHIAMMLRRL